MNGSTSICIKYVNEYSPPMKEMKKRACKYSQVLIESGLIYQPPVFLYCFERKRVLQKETS